VVQRYPCATAANGDAAFGATCFPAERTLLDDMAIVLDGDGVFEQINQAAGVCGAAAGARASLDHRVPAAFPRWLRHTVAGTTGVSGQCSLDDGVRCNNRSRFAVQRMGSGYSGIELERNSYYQGQPRVDPERPLQIHKASDLYRYAPGVASDRGHAAAGERNARVHHYFLCAISEGTARGKLSRARIRRRVRRTAAAHRDVFATVFLRASRRRRRRAVPYVLVYAVRTRQRESPIDIERKIIIGF